jgi:N-acyl homoserine lactone hydrolase
MKLYSFECGVLKLKLSNIKAGWDVDQDYQIPVAWYVIEHPRGNILIDGGNAAAVATQPEAHWGVITQWVKPVMEPSQFCVLAMQSAGLSPDSIRYVIQSHLHHDHTGAIGNFRNAIHIVRRREMEYAYTPDRHAAPSYCRKDFDRLDLRWQFIEPSIDVVDFYSDNSVLLVPTPGHSPGHQSFLLNLPQTGPVLLTIDAVITMDHWHDRALAGLTTSMSDALRSVERLKAIVERTSAMLIPGHDPERWETIRRAPAFYQ